jgi:hypothetical protein
VKRHVERRCQLEAPTPRLRGDQPEYTTSPNVQKLEKPASKETMFTNWWFQPLEKYESQIGSSFHQPAKIRAKIQPGLLSNVQKKWSNGCTVQDIEKDPEYIPLALTISTTKLIPDSSISANHG